MRFGVAEYWWLCRQFVQEEEDMKAAWDLFDADGGGSVDAEEFKIALPLMGENVPEEEVCNSCFCRT